MSAIRILYEYEKRFPMVDRLNEQSVCLMILGKVQARISWNHAMKSRMRSCGDDGLETHAGEDRSVIDLLSSTLSSRLPLELVR